MREKPGEKKRSMARDGRVDRTRKPTFTSQNVDSELSFWPSKNPLSLFFGYGSRKSALFQPNAIRFRKIA